MAGGPPLAPNEQGQPAPAGRRGRRRPARADHAQAGPSGGEAGPTCSRRVLLRGRLRRLLATPLAVRPRHREPGAGCGQSTGGPPGAAGQDGRLDAAGLLRTLMALERGEMQVCRVVHVPTPAQEDARRRSRERARLIVERGQHTSRIKGLLMTQGIRDFEPTRRDWQARFEALRTPDGLLLAPCLRAELLRECRRLWLVMEMIAEVEAEQKAVAEAEDGPAARLAQLRGIGLAFATVLGDEVFFRDFRNRREVGGYLGLAPSPWQSGSLRRDQGIAKSGNPRARRTAIELAWLWLRHQPGSALTRWFHERVGSTKGRMRRILLVAMARKLIVALWRYVTVGLVPEGAVLKI